TASGPFSASIIVHAGIDPAGDKDVFAVENTTGVAATVHFETFGTSVGVCAGIDTQLRVRDAAGSLLAFDDDGGVSFCSALDVVVAPGATVYAEVVGFGGALIPAYLLQIGFPP